ncbi:F0F1 ATP synthase subunit alpha [Verrucomicrobiota bacterium]
MPSVQIDSSSITAVLEEKARHFAVRLGTEEIGHVLEAGDGIARVDGLPGVMAEEMVLFPNEVYGMAMNLERDDVGVIVLGDYSRVEQGDVVRRTGKVLEVPVGEALLGRVVTPLGRPIDGRGPVAASEYRRVEVDAPGIVDREPVSRPLQTGLKSIDSMTAIGRGQRELIVGDRQTGKTALAIDTILNQKRGDVRCFYVAIGQKMSTVAGIVDTLRSHDVMSNCTVVVATASDSAPLQYIAPFAGCAMAELVRDSGGDALIVYDDLSKHAVAYREISLLLRRPPGREAYPGDIFYLHSRLLERASNLHPDHGGGSLTALPIIETKEGDYSAYIPTNLISITDGQIYLESDLFHQGFRPAINVGLSVSRVGGRAQLPAMKKVAIKLRIELAQYRELASFSQLTSDLDPATLKQLHRGERLAAVLKQAARDPMPVEKQVCILWAASSGHLDSVPLCDVARFEKEWFELLDTGYAGIGREILESGDLGKEAVKDLERSMEQFKQVFVLTRDPELLDRDRVVPRAPDQDERLSDTMVEAGR